MSELKVPNHIGYIVDGNRRWAKKHGLPVYEGHLAGYNALIDVVVASFEAGAKYVSVYSFSTENWERSQDEVKNIMSLVLKMLTADLPILEKNSIKLCVLGSRDGLDERVMKAIDNAESKTANNKSGTLALCFNYGGRLEIVDAIKKIVQSGTKPKDINVDLVERNLYSPEVPPVDIVVRTSGEKRVSNFMLWRIAYSELLFMDKLWPDMKKTDVADIVKEYSRRSRRFGV